jgi:hypothetical protein
MSLLFDQDLVSSSFVDVFTALTVQGGDAVP